MHKILKDLAVYIIKDIVFKIKHVSLNPESIIY